MNLIHISKFYFNKSWVSIFNKSTTKLTCLNISLLIGLIVQNCVIILSTFNGYFCVFTNLWELTSDWQTHWTFLEKNLDSAKGFDDSLFNK